MSEFSIYFNPPGFDAYPRTVQETVDHVALNANVEKPDVDPIYVKGSTLPDKESTDKIWIHVPNPQDVPQPPPLPIPPPPATSSTFKILTPFASQPQENSTTAQADRFGRFASNTGANDSTFQAPFGVYNYVIYAGNSKFYAVKDGQVIRLSDTGLIDNTFTPIEIPAGTGDSLDTPQENARTIKLCLRPDRKLFVYSSRGINAFFGLYNENGSSAAVSPILYYNAGWYYTARICDVSIQEDNKILINGDFNSYSRDNNYNPIIPITNPMGICRLNADLSLDDTFSPDSSIPNDANIPRSESNFYYNPPNNPYYGKILALGSGKILVYREGVLLRLLANGSKDPTFTSGFSSATGALIEDANNKIYVSDGASISRLNSNGSIDLTFNFSASSSSYTNFGFIVPSPTGQEIFVAATSTFTTGSILKISSTGAIDTNFSLPLNVNLVFPFPGSPPARTYNLIAQGAPSITSPDYVPGSINQPFSFSITVNPSPASSYAVDILPPGLTLNTSTGIISGTPTQAGITTVVVSASNAFGTATKGINIQIFEAILTINFNTPALRFYRDSVWNEISPVKRGDIILVPIENYILFPWGESGRSYDLSPWGQPNFTVPVLPTPPTGFKYKYYVGTAVSIPLPPDITI